MTIPTPSPNLIPTIIHYRGATYWLLTTERRYHTLQHAESGDLINIFAQSDVADYHNISRQIAVARIHQAIHRERSYQDHKYGTPQQRDLVLSSYVRIARNELDEAMIAIVDGDHDNARCELLQVAAVVVAALEAHGLIERTDLPQITNHQSPSPSPHNKRLSDQ